MRFKRLQLVLSALLVFSDEEDLNAEGRQAAVISTMLLFYSLPV